MIYSMEYTYLLCVPDSRIEEMRRKESFLRNFVKYYVTEKFRICYGTRSQFDSTLINLLHTIEPEKNFLQIYIFCWKCFYNTLCNFTSLFFSTFYIIFELLKSSI